MNGREPQEPRRVASGFDSGDADKLAPKSPRVSWSAQKLHGHR
jgi:hypothetical protein